MASARTREGLLAMIPSPSQCCSQAGKPFQDAAVLEVENPVGMLLRVTRNPLDHPAPKDARGFDQQQDLFRFRHEIDRPCLTKIYHYFGKMGRWRPARFRVGLANRW
jgi:hypothetical protein